MPRVKRGLMAHKRKHKVIKAAKGYKWRRKSTFRAAKEAVIKAGKYAFRDRRAKKGVFRRLWILRLNNALKELGYRYSVFIKAMKTKKIELDRKVLSEMAAENPEIFRQFSAQVMA